MARHFSRRNFLGAISAGAAAGTGLNAGGKRRIISRPSGGADGRLAVLGGKPLRSEAFSSWPQIQEEDRRVMKAALESKVWNRGRYVEEFESNWAKKLGANYALATASGTAALYTSLYALGIGPGDEVIVPPYTFVATINVVLLHRALPVFVDSDRETFQIDARKIESAITDRTRCILPVHLGGSSADMDAISGLSRKHELPVIEDACQAHLGEWRNRKVGTLGDLGCFSFQATKNLNCGEGGAITSLNGELMAECASFHNSGRKYVVNAKGELEGDRSYGFTYAANGDNRRITEFQGAMLLAQLARLEDQTQVRERNATYLTSLLKEIPGIEPARMYPGCTRNAYHLYMFRYNPEGFAGISRKKFLSALKAEGIPCSDGYGPLNKEPFLENSFASRGFQKIYGDKELRELQERNLCPENDKLCEEAVWIGQTELLGPRNDMDQIASAIRKIQRQASQLV